MPYAIYYWDYIVINTEFDESWRPVLDNIYNAEYSIAGLEQKQFGSLKLYTAKINASDRLLFTTIILENKRCLLWLESIPNHDYQKAKLSQKKSYEIYLAKFSKITNIDQLSLHHLKCYSPTIEPTPKETLSVSLKEKQLISYNNQIILLNEMQTSVLSATLPALIGGPPGSGKTCVSISLLLSKINQFIVNGQNNASLVYVTKSKILASQIKHQWQDIYIQPIDFNGKAYFLTYDELILWNNLSDEQIYNLVDKTHCIDWIAQYKISSPVKKNKNPMLNVESIAIYHEFLIASAVINQNNVHDAYIQSEYAKSGIRECVFYEQKEWIYQAYQQYKLYLLSMNQTHLAFSPLNPIQNSADLKFDFICVDEAQDLSTQNLQNVLQLTRNSHVAFCMDSHQSLDFGLSIRPFILKQLHRLNGVSIQLETTYRLPPAVMDFANRLLLLKLNLIGGLSDKDEYSQIKLRSENQDKPGSFLWTSNSDSEIDDDVLRLTSTTDFAVIVISQDEKENAKTRFHTPLVFTVEEIRGLEYKYILIYNPLADARCRNVSARIKEKGMQPTQSIEIAHRSSAKTEALNNEEIIMFFNALFISITRSTHSLWIYQPILEPQIEHQVSALKACLIPSAQTPKQDIIIEPSTDVMWKTEASRLQANGNLSHADEIRKQCHSKTAEKMNRIPLLALINNQDKSVEPVSLITLKDEPIIETTPTDFIRNLVLTKNPFKFFTSSITYIINTNNPINYMLEPVGSKKLPFFLVFFRIIFDKIENATYGIKDPSQPCLYDLKPIFKPLLSITLDTLQQNDKTTLHDALQHFYGTEIGFLFLCELIHMPMHKSFRDEMLQILSSSQWLSGGELFKMVKHEFKLLVCPHGLELLCKISQIAPKLKPVLVNNFPLEILVTPNNAGCTGFVLFLLKSDHLLSFSPSEQKKFSFMSYLLRESLKKYSSNEKLRKTLFIRFDNTKKNPSTHITSVYGSFMHYLLSSPIEYYSSLTSSLLDLMSHFNANDMTTKITENITFEESLFTTTRGCKILLNLLESNPRFHEHLSLNVFTSEISFDSSPIKKSLFLWFVLNEYSVEIMNLFLDNQFDITKIMTRELLLETVDGHSTFKGQTALYRLILTPASRVLFSRFLTINPWIAQLINDDDIIVTNCQEKTPCKNYKQVLRLNECRLIISDESDQQPESLREFLLSTPKGNELLSQLENCRKTCNQSPVNTSQQGFFSDKKELSGDQSGLLSSPGFDPQGQIVVNGY